MADDTGTSLRRAASQALLSLANATLLLVLCCLCVGIWGVFKVEQVAGRILVTAERTLVSTVAPQTDRLVDSLQQIQFEVRQVGEGLQRLTVAVDRSQSITLPPSVAKEAQRLIQANSKLTAAIDAVSAGDFHLSQQAWQHIANTAGDVVRTAIACRTDSRARSDKDG